MAEKVLFFKENGKYYTEETVYIPMRRGLDEVYQIIDWLKENVKQHRGMHLVIAELSGYSNGYPIMIPACDRR